jgi:3',5'-cyclic AMP phosphodiesterase CpdA
VATRVLHVSDLHAGRREAPGLAAALAVLVEESDPELVIATGDLAHRGRTGELQQARALLTGLGRPLLVVPGNHDIPYTLPARLSRPWSRFEAVFGTTDPDYHSEGLVVCGLNSVRPWRHQGGRLTPDGLRRVSHAFRNRSREPTALRVVALHHHLAGAPWRASRKFPLKHRDHVLAVLAAAGTDLVIGGHIHQSVVTTRWDFEVLDVFDDGPAESVVLATAPGLGRPRPHRTGEAQGALVYECDTNRLTVLTYVLAGTGFAQIARREFPRVPAL